MRKGITITVALMMVLMGFMAMAAPVAADPVPTIGKTLKINGCPCGGSAWLNDIVTYEITTWVPDGMGGGSVTDEIPDCLSYLIGTFTVVKGDVTNIKTNKEISYDVGEGETIIAFDTLYDSAPGNPQGEPATNIASLEVGDTTYESCPVTFTAKKYCNFNKYVSIMRDEGDGDKIIEVGENIVWKFTMKLYNSYSWDMEDVFVWDRFGAEIEIDDYDPTTEEIDEISITHGDWDFKTKGKSKKVFLTWDIGYLPAGAVATLELQISTDLNPSLKQAYTSPGEYEMNSGGVVKFLNPDDIQLSAHTDIIEVTVI
jgi:hypothetical protein